MVAADFDADVDAIRISNGALTTNQFIQKSVALQPIVSSLLPANGASNVSPAPLIEAVLQNRDTSVVTGSVKLFIDGTDVTASSTNSATISTAQVDYVPAAPLASGAHTATITFQDTAVPVNSWTNSWNFTTVTTIPVVALYQFNEKAAGELADISAGAIVDSSGNGHNGTVLPGGRYQRPCVCGRLHRLRCHRGVTFHLPGGEDQYRNGSRPE